MVSFREVSGRFPTCRRAQLSCFLSTTPWCRPELEKYPLHPFSKFNLESLLLQDDLQAYRYLKQSRKNVAGVNDVTDFTALNVVVLSSQLTFRMH